MMKLLLLCAVIGIAVGEAPYPPSGWRPQGAQFNLPNQYGAPQRQNYEVEVTRENVEYVGTVTESPENPPADDDSEDDLRVQGIPTTNAPRFNPPQSSRQRVQQSQFRGQYTDPQEFEVARNLKSGQLRANVQFGRQQAGPQQEYGPPTRATRPQAEQQPEEDPEDTEDPENNGQTVVAVANAGSSGQYYVLSQDNTLQRVMFLTRQTEEDRRRNGFTAQLRYSPVQPITDPIYVYNEQGQLIRVFNK
ncbi:uncharacterized protein LOC129803818 [Phlebotomus papatasi]|uniref:uncharacterized protein LOC129803818 n=1 Tax=Phlebotomus papatasi TaxID=29031 RepID=UPI0024844B37|nr:uncharacterized protein LOC129803818 [Phlebotomus papatasi]